MNTALIVILLVAAVVIGTLIVFRSGKKSNREIKQAAAQETTKDKSISPESVLEPLVSLDLSLRQAMVPRDVIDHFGQCTDILWDLVPRMFRDYPGEELTIVLQFIAKQHLPGLVQGYLKLSPELFEENKPRVIDGLEILNRELDKTVAIVNSQQIGNFDSQVRFLKARFGNEGIES